ncbi:MAG: cysteine--tRNA ligase [Neomegalonema sp.]|nr:cysteine--tRNA ligase [Neomegalonema sp.]
MGNESVREIRLYDTLSREKRVFKPLNPERIGLYACGPTVYDRVHIGNLRSAVVYDALTRFLRAVYGSDKVVFVRNITDIDDKIIVRAAENDEPIEALTKRTHIWYHEDTAALGCAKPDIEPMATDHIPQMIALIERLIEQGKAYAAEGHALFSVKSYEDYGALSRRSVDDMIAGARVEVAPYKRDPMDFVLWKPSSDDQPGWDSPWGRGRPGWHIECSAMSAEHLGESFDIHGGGLDLTFPHHENERAQSLCGNPNGCYARYWVHNGMLTVDGEKMSKSLGNFITMADLEEKTPGEVVRMALLMSHYRQPFDWSNAIAEEARTVLTRWRKLTEGVDAAAEVPEPVMAALADDFNTPKAIAEMHQMASAGKAADLKASAQLMGLLTDALGGWEKAPEAGADVAAKIDALIEARMAARKAKDFAKADAIRDGLAAAGVEVKDSAQGAEWSLGRDFDATKLPEAGE